MSKTLWFLSGCVAGIAVAAAAEVLSENDWLFSSQQDSSSPADDEDNAPITVADAADEDQISGASVTVIV